VNAPTRPTPPARPRLVLSLPRTPAGKWAGWLALGAFASLVLANILMAAGMTGSRNVLRLVLLLMFAVGSVGALVQSVRALVDHDRSVVVWTSLVFGVSAAVLLLAEFTIME